MRAFAELLDRLALTGSRNAKLVLLRDYLRATSDPDRGVRLRAVDILEEIAQRDHQPGSVNAVRDEALVARSLQGEARLNAFLISTRNSGASDFHLSVGQPPIIRMGADTPLAGARRRVMVQKFARHAAIRLQWFRDPGVAALSV